MREILIGFILCFVFLPTLAYALVEIEPASENLSIFSDLEYVFNIGISGVDDVYGFQLDLTYDPEIFEISNQSDVSEGTFLSRNGQDTTHCISPDISTPGLIDNFACSRMGSGSVSGSGTLASVKLKPNLSATLPATSDIVLLNLKVSDINSQPLDNSTESGNSTVYECLSGETRSCVGGTRTCTPYNQWGSCITSPAPPSGGGSPGVGSAPPGGTGSNGDGLVLDGDIVGDGCVDIQDLMLIAANFGLTSGFDERADVNRDGIVDIFDLVIVALEFGKGPNCQV